MKDHVSRLQDSALYPDATESVELRETHISWVFLTDEYVYKFKKPVSFEFLDFSTLEKRREACQNEVRLNRRLAPDTYLGLIPLLENEGVAGDEREGEHRDLFFGELLSDPEEAETAKLWDESDGPKKRLVDWAVKMRRLDDQQSLESKIETDSVASHDIDQIAKVLNAFYQASEPAPIDGEAYVSRVENHIRGNFDDLLDNQSLLDDLKIKRIHGAQLRYLLTHQADFQARTNSGLIVDGHGDLRPDHIYLTPEPVILDCIEFNSEFRQIDVADELSFLGMECERLGSESIRDRLLAECQSSIGCELDSPVLPFYFSYRACVRAKVDLLRAKQMSEEQREPALCEINEYLELADRAVDRLGQPVLIVVRGLSGVGKTTIADRISNELAAEHLSTDLARDQLMGDLSKEEKYRPKNRERVYEYLLDQASHFLSHRINVVLDGTFLQQTLHKQAREICDARQASLLFVDCVCSTELAEQRIAERGKSNESRSEATLDIHNQQRERWESVPDSLAQIQLDTAKSIENSMREIFATLSEG